MKVIDLLNKIANGEEIPERIIYDNIVFEYKNGEYSTEGNGSCLEEFINFYKADFNKEVEIIEDKKIKPLDYKYINTYGNVSQCKKSEERIIDKINEIIDKINEEQK